MELESDDLYGTETASLKKALISIRTKRLFQGINCSGHLIINTVEGTKSENIHGPIVITPWDLCDCKTYNFQNSFCDPPNSKIIISRFVSTLVYTSSQTQCLTVGLLRQSYKSCQLRRRPDCSRLAIISHRQS